jgi:hypothetical protein
MLFGLFGLLLSYWAYLEGAHPPRGNGNAMFEQVRMAARRWTVFLKAMYEARITEEQIMD